MRTRISLVSLAVGVLALSPAAASAAKSKRAPTLTYAQAKGAAFAYSLKFASTDATATHDTLDAPPVVGTLFRNTRLSYFAQSSWTKTDPDGCQDCGYNETTGESYDTPEQISCFLDLIVTRASRKPFRTTVRIRDSSCA